MPRKIQFVCLLAVLGLLLTAAQSGFAQSVNGPLNFGNNYFVTGDYVVAGAAGMSVNIAGGYGIGTIAVPDPNPGITGASLVPPGAEVVAALLYWQTVEKTGTVAGQTGSGENGYFMPVGLGGPKAPGYPISGVQLASADTVPYSSSGCTSTSTGEVVRTYRANVYAALPRDSTGNISANGIYEVYLPSVRNSTPMTLGATLVLIYRILSPSVPLNAIVIYDGAYAPGTTALTMKQTMQGFYDAAPGPVSRLTHIVGQGKVTKAETVYLDNAVLPSLYGREPAFPGYYGTWDNPTWTFNPTETYVRVANPIVQGAPSASTEVIPYSSGEGCLSWGAVIVSTTVLNSDGDGLLDVWKTNPASPGRPGYCDASVNEGVCTPGSVSWVDLPGALHGEKDVFIQLDYMCNSPTGGDTCATGNGNYSFDPRPSGAIGLVTSAFNAKAGVHPFINLHINPSGTNQPDIHAIPETTCVDNLTATPPQYCAFPEQPGVVAWKGGFDFIKNQLVDPTAPTNTTICTTSPTLCVPRFQPGKRTSWHYVLSTHAVGQPEWKLQDSSLVSVKQSLNTVTFTTSAEVGVLDSIGMNSVGNNIPDPTCKTNGRVTILGAASNPNLNGTFCVTSTANAASYTFTITVGGSPTTASYTYYTDPNLAVAPGFTSTASGVSDVGGADSLVSLGLWGNPAFNGTSAGTTPVSDGQSESVLAGTFMHELGHSIGLTHGGYTYALQALGDFVPTLYPNCKPNHQSVMNYAFQVDLLTPLTPGSSNVPDYSGQVLASLNEAKAGVANVFSSLAPAYASTSWYIPYTHVGTAATIHCNGTPITNGASMSVAIGLTSTLSWTGGQDINFDGNTTETLTGYNDWTNINLQQIGATGTNSTAEGGGQNFGGGGQNFGGGGQNLGGGGQNLGGGGQNFGGGGQNLGGGGQNFGGGGQNFGGGGEVNSATANSVTRPPQNLMALEGASPRAIGLTWQAPSFGQIGQYNVYRGLKGGALSFLGSVSGNPPARTYTDTTATCNATGYQYFVTAVLSGTTQESAGSNTVSTGTNGVASGQGALTGCYTNTPPTVSLTTLAVPNTSFVQGSTVPVTWSLQDDYNTTGAYVNNLLANSLVAIGPFSSDQGCPASLPSGGTVTQLMTKGVIQSGAGASTFAFSLVTNQFTFTWDTTPFNAGCYFFTLTLDSAQTETTTSPLTVLIYVSGSMPHITTTTLTAGTVGTAYSNTIFEAGGVSSFTWTVSAGSTPPGITLGSFNGTLTGTSCVAGNYNFTAKVTDSKSNFGTQSLMLQIQKADTTTSVVPTTVTPPANPAVWRQPITFTVTVAPQSPCTPPTGTVTLLDGSTPIASSLALTGGKASFTTSLLSVASHSITATYSGDSNFNATNSDAGSTATILTQVVNRADTTSLVISSSNSNTSTYGQTVTFTTTVSAVAPGAGTPTGWVTFEDSGVALAGSSKVSLVGGTASFTTTATELTAGTHSITAVYGGDTDFNKTGYDSGSTDNTLVQMVNQAPLSADVSGTEIYGGLPSYIVTQYIGFISPDSQTSGAISGTFAGCTTNATITNTSPAVGIYNVLNCTALSSLNYIITYSGALYISPAPLTATVTGTQIYGGTPVFTPAYSGFVNGDTSSTVQIMGPLTSCAATAMSTSPVGNSYMVSLPSCSGLTTGNYTIGYASGAFSVTPAPLTASVSGAESLAPPTFGVTSIGYSPFANGETSSVVNGTLSCAVVVPTGGGTAGSNPISCNGLSAGNYNISYDYSGLHAITGATPAPLTVNVIGSVTGGGAPAFSLTSYSLTGLLGNDAPSIVTGTLSCVPLAATDSSGQYPISCTGLSATGYAISYSYSYGGSATAPTPLTVAVSGAVQSGDQPTFTVSSLTYSGFVNGDTVSAVNGTLSCTLGAEVSPNYPITCLGLTSANYNVSYDFSQSTGIVTTTPSPLIVTVTGTTPSLTYTFSGFVNGDTPTPPVVTGTLSCTTGAADGAGNVPISCTGLSAANYTIAYSYSYSPGRDTTKGQATLTINVIGTVPQGSGGTPPLTITSVTYSGFVNDDTLSAVTGTLSCTTKPGPTALNPYLISVCGGLTAPGCYSISYWAGKVTVKP